MESVIDKLSEIETAASRIMESAVEETRRQDNAAEDVLSYDNDTDAQVQNIGCQTHFAGTGGSGTGTPENLPERSLSTWMFIIRT
ncbi:MAG: hypothetical protein ACLTA7_04545 [Ruminococcus sp.]